MSEWVIFETDNENVYKTKNGIFFYHYYGEEWTPSTKQAYAKKYYEENVVGKKTYEQLEMEANIKKLEWTIAEQQLEIERLRQKELESSKGKNNE